MALEGGRTVTAGKMDDGDSICLIGQQIGQDQFPGGPQAAQVRCHGGAVQHVAQVNDGSSQHHHQGGRAGAHQLGEDELRRASKDDCRHGLGFKRQEAGFHSQHAVDHAERHHSNQQRQLGLYASLEFRELRRN